MLNNFPAIGIAIIVTAVVIGVGYIVIQGLVDSNACPSGFEFNDSATLGGGTECYETINTSHEVSYNSLGSNLMTTQGYLGTSSGGLGSWILPVIALAVGLFFIGALMGRKR